MLLGGAALTRSYVEHDLREIYDGDVLYGKDAFEGLRHMDAIMAFKRGETTVVAGRGRAGAQEGIEPGRSARIDVDRAVARGLARRRRPEGAVHAARAS